MSKKLVKYEDLETVVKNHLSNGDTEITNEDLLCKCPKIGDIIKRYSGYSVNFRNRFTNTKCCTLDNVYFPVDFYAFVGKVKKYNINASDNIYTIPILCKSNKTLYNGKSGFKPTFKIEITKNNDIVSEMTITGSAVDSFNETNYESSFNVILTGTTNIIDIRVIDSNLDKDGLNGVGPFTGNTLVEVTPHYDEKINTYKINDCKLIPGDTTKNLTYQLTISDDGYENIKDGSTLLLKFQVYGDTNTYYNEITTKDSEQLYELSHTSITNYIQNISIVKGFYNYTLYPHSSNYSIDAKNDVYTGITNDKISNNIAISYQAPPQSQGIQYKHTIYIYSKYLIGSPFVSSILKLCYKTNTNAYNPAYQNTDILIENITPTTNTQSNLFNYRYQTTITTTASTMVLVYSYIENLTNGYSTSLTPSLIYDYTITIYNKKINFVNLSIPEKITLSNNTLNIPILLVSENNIQTNAKLSMDFEISDNYGFPYATGSTKNYTISNTGTSLNLTISADVSGISGIVNGDLLKITNVTLSSTSTYDYIVDFDSGPFLIN